MINIAYGQDLAYVEAVMKQELPAIAKANPGIVAGPFYRGVEALGDSSVVVGVHVLCNEIDVMTVSCILNHDVLQIFYRNGINVLFPNLTISQLDTRDRQTIVDLSDADGDGSEG